METTGDRRGEIYPLNTREGKKGGGREAPVDACIMAMKQNRHTEREKKKKKK